MTGIMYPLVIEWIEQSHDPVGMALLDDYRAHGETLTASQWDMAWDLYRRRTSTSEVEPHAEDTAPEVALPEETVVPIGTFTLEKDDGSWRTFRTVVQPPDSKFAPGRIVLMYLAGRDNTTDFRGFAFVNGRPGETPVLVPWERFRKDTSLMEDAQKMLDDPDSLLTSRQCIICHHTLTVPSSVHSNIGPKCAKKGWS